MLIDPVLWPAVGMLLVAGMAFVLNRLNVARMFALGSIGFGTVAALASIANLVALAISPQRFFGDGIPPDSMAAMSTLVAPRWLNVATFGTFCVAASMAIRAAVVRRSARSARSASEAIWIGLGALSIGAAAWIRLALSPQVLASTQTGTAALVVETYLRFGRPLPGAAVAPGERAPMTDYWGRPFGYLVRDDCFVLISYGSDGKPDSNDYDAKLCDSTATAVTCLWPTQDTIFVNDRPLRSCLLYSARR